MQYIQLIKLNYEAKISEFREYVKRKCLDIGEDITPYDVANIMNKADNSGVFKNILFNGFTSPYGKFLLMIDIYEGLDDYLIDKELKALNINNLQEFF